MNRIKVSGLWKNTDRNGETYYGGNLSPGVRILIFKNGFKDGDRDPDLVMYLAPSEKREEDSHDREEG